VDNLEQETIKWCREVLRNSPTAIRVLKSALNAVDDGHAGLQVPWLLIASVWRNFLDYGSVLFT